VCARAEAVNGKAADYLMALRWERMRAPRAFANKEQCEC